jgi:hypothetical protein
VFAHPAIYYIRYLLLVLPDPSRDEVNRQLALYGLGELKKEQFEQIAADLPDPPAGFRMHDRRHSPSVKWLKAVKIYSMVHRDQVVEAVFSKVLPNRKLRETLERLILGNVTPQEASYRLRELGFKVADTVIAEFAHYFWNANALGVSDWADYFSKDASRGRTGYVSDGYLSALHGGPELALYRSGIQVEVDSKALLEEIQRELAFTFMEVRQLPLSQKKVEMMGTIVRNVVKVDERLSASDAALADVLKRFEKFVVVDDTSEVPSIVDLAASGTVSDTSRIEVQRSKERTS